MPILDHSMKDFPGMEIKIGGDQHPIKNNSDYDSIIKYGNAGIPLDPHPQYYDLNNPKELIRYRDENSERRLHYDNIKQVNIIDGPKNDETGQGSILYNLERNKYIMKEGPSVPYRTELRPNQSIGEEARFNETPIFRYAPMFAGRHLQIPFEKNSEGEVIVTYDEHIKNDPYNNGSKANSLKNRGLLK